jgi:hypothetical protein
MKITLYVLPFFCSPFFFFSSSTFLPHHPSLFNSPFCGPLEKLEASGEIDIKKVDKIEIIFDVLTKFPDMSICTNLHKIARTTFPSFIFFAPLVQIPSFSFFFSVIGNNLKVIPSFQGIKETLTSLCLAQQSIERIENLSELTNLKELFLYENQISQITDLQQYVAPHLLPVLTSSSSFPS